MNTRRTESTSIHIEEVVHMATLKPLNDRIVVKAVTPQEKTAGGIILPDCAQEKPQEAEVVAVGPGKTAGKRQSCDPGSQGRRHHHLREVWRHRNQGRLGRICHSAPGRRAGDQGVGIHGSERLCFLRKRRDARWSAASIPWRMPSR